MINPTATKDLLIEQADLLYAEHGYVLQPLYLIPAQRPEVDRTHQALDKWNPNRADYIGDPLFELRR